MLEVYEVFDASDETLLVELGKVQFLLRGAVGFERTRLAFHIKH